MHIGAIHDQANQTHSYGAGRDPGSPSPEMPFNLVYCVPTLVQLEEDFEGPEHRKYL